MKAVLFILFIMVAFPIIAVILANKKRTNSEGETFEKFSSGNNFGSIISNRPITAVLKSDHLYIYDNLNKDINVSLDYKKITNVKVTSSKEISEKAKSVGGRALVGGIALGPIGAILGGMSGIGTKQKEIVHNYILITYRHSNDSEESGILLQVGVNAWADFMKELQEKANVVPSKSVEL